MQDAVLAAEAGVDGILISNHGGMFTHSSYSIGSLEYFRTATRIVSIPSEYQRYG